MTAVLADTSVWMRRDQTDVAERLSGAIDDGRATMTTPIALELLRSALDAVTARSIASELGVLPWIPLTAAVERRATDVLLGLARRGYHRGPSPVDLLAAAAAEVAGAEFWHCDRHFDLIAEVTGQPMQRVGR
ncbi:MAG TPA: PIN domain-containing protein [Gaiellaceae bacterium]|nr:PIN domain-containing protein [Gaiellaceae bacterium]